MTEHGAASTFAVNGQGVFVMITTGRPSNKTDVESPVVKDERCGTL
jgi:hypothetical protein